jgi:RimJ/RimL family protein N-acetyltransferase
MEQMTRRAMACSPTDPARESTRAPVRCVAIPRRLSDVDRGAVLAHLLRLSDQDRQMRFCRVFPDESVAAYVASIDFKKDVCFGMFDEGVDLIALVQSFPYDDGGVRMIEAAFSTDAVWRCQGLATMLFHQVTDYAVEQRIDGVIAQCLAGNRPMRALLRAVGAVCAVEDGEVTGEWELV